MTCPICKWRHGHADDCPFRRATALRWDDLYWAGIVGAYAWWLEVVTFMR